jgi:hypothetical protein
MSAASSPRPHRRARIQLLLGYLPLLVIAAAVLAVLAVRLAPARAELSRAGTVAQARVVATGQAPDGRGLRVSIDAGGTPRTGVLVLPGPSAVALGTRFPVSYDPRSPVDRTAVHVPGDATDQRVRNTFFGLIVVVAVLLAATVLTGLRLLSRPRLRRAPVTEVTATRFGVRQGLLVRSWLELVTARGVRWVPVHWSEELARLGPGSLIGVHGRPERGRLVLPVADGAEVWPSGRVRNRAPRGERRQADPDPESSGTWGRQLRGDAVGLVVAPVLGLLWAYLDGSGAGGFAVATVVAAAALFWLAQLLGSDPAPPDRD